MKLKFNIQFISTKSHTIFAKLNKIIGEIDFAKLFDIVEKEIIILFPDLETIN